MGQRMLLTIHSCYHVKTIKLLAGEEEEADHSGAIDGYISKAFQCQG